MTMPAQSMVPTIKPNNIGKCVGHSPTFETFHTARGQQKICALRSTPNRFLKISFRCISGIRPQ